MRKLPLLLSLVGLLGEASLAEEKRPNVLFLFTDDQRQETIQAWGNDKIQTPHMDRLVKDGLSFRNAYIMGGSSPAVCSPSRASLFSGRTLWNIECQGKFAFEISEKFKTLPQVFRESGYETFATGKNEPGKKGHFARSFSAGESILFKGMCNHYRLPLYAYDPEGKYDEKKPVVLTGKHSAEVYADACINFLNQHKASEKPFFAYVAFQTPHDPLLVPDEFLARYDEVDIPLFEPFLPEHPFDNGMLKVRDEMLEKFPRTADKLQQRLKAYFALITYTDAQIGRILAALDEHGMTEDTIIVFASDNGLALGSHGLLGKQNVYEHSVKVPMIISGPGLPNGEERQQFTYIYDIYPTLCDLAGIETPDTVQYRSLKPVIDDAKAKHRDYLYFAFMEWQRAVRDERYKLIEYCVDEKRTTQLFDLQEDPTESRNLAADEKHQDNLKRLRRMLEMERVAQNDGKTPYEFSNAQGVKFWTTYLKTAESTSCHPPSLKLRRTSSPSPNPKQP